MISRVLSRLKGPVAAGLLLLAAWPVWKAFVAQRSLASWYFPRLAVTWGYTALFSAACLVIGASVVRALTGPVRRDGFWALSFSTGVLVFGASMGVLGHLQLFGPALIGVLPLVLLLVGWRSFADAALDAREAWRRQAPLTAPELVLGAVGLLGVVMAFLPVLAPENINYDARWYHLVIADRYALLGGITRSVEGNHLLAGPHLASLLYTWAFLQEGAGTFEKALLANHLEVACFLGTLALVPPLARALSPKDSAPSQRMAWVAVLLFPSLYIYDTGLMGGADHVAALWAPASLLTFFQARERADARSWALFGLSFGALALTKYTSIILIVPLLVMVVAVVPTWPLTRARLWPRLQGPLVAGGVTLAVTSLHWLRNLVFYGNPVYPLASRLFTGSTPWTRDSLAWHEWYSRELFVPSDARLGSRIAELGDALWGYHLDLYTWKDFTAGLPVFGSLYAISLVLLPFVRGGRRLWALTLAVHVAIALWFTLAHQMRYLIVLVPLMAASCAVLAVEAWRWRSWPVRLALLAVVGVQVVGAGDAPFAPTHRTNGKVSPLGRAVAFLGRGIAEENENRFRLWKDLEDVGAALPPRAVVLVHSSHATLGFGRVVLTDSPGIQYGLDYAELGSVSAIHRKLVELGVSHVASVDSVSHGDSVAGELLFRTLVQTATAERKVVNGWTLAELAPEPPPDASPVVFYLGCGAAYANGLYPLSWLSAPVRPSTEDPSWAAPSEPGALPELMAKANFLVVEDGCSPATPIDASFQYAGRQEVKGLTRAYYFRRPPLVP